MSIFRNTKKKLARMVHFNTRATLGGTFASDK